MGILYSFLLIVVLAGCRAGTPPGAGAPLPAAKLDLFEYDFLNAYDFFRSSVDARGAASFVVDAGSGEPTQRFTAAKEPGTRRIFLLGGSVAQMFELKELEAMLAALLPGRRVELINCGASGYDTVRETVLLDRVLRWEPDLIILMTGVNEVQPLPPSWLAAGARRMKGRSLLGPAFRKSAALWVLAARGWYAFRVWRLGRVRCFEENLRRMLRLGKGRGASVLVCTLPVNLRDMPPSGVLPLRQASFLRGWLAWERGAWLAGAEGFRAYLAESPGSASGHYWLARCLDRSGDFAAAKEEYIRAWNLPGSRNPVPAMNEAVRRLAAEEGAPLADLELAFAEASPQGIIGRNIMEDDVHYEPYGYTLASAAIARALWRGAPGTGRPLLAPDREWHPEAFAGIERALRPGAGGAIDGRKKSWRTFRYYMWAPLAKDAALFSERVLALMETIRLAHPGLMEDMRELKSWMADKLADNLWDQPSTLESLWPRLLAHAGESYRRSGRYPAAVSYFSEALRLDPALDKARFCRALAYQASGSQARALADLAGIPLARRTPEMALWLSAIGAVFPPYAPPPAGDGEAAPRPGGGRRRERMEEGNRVFTAGAERPPAGSAPRPLRKARAESRPESPAVPQGTLRTASSAGATAPLPPDAVSAGTRRLAEAGLAAWSAGRREEAAASLQQALAAGPAGAVSDTLKQAASVPGGIGGLALFREAIGSFCASGQVDCAPLDATLAEMRRLNDAGIAAWSAGRREEAAEWFDKVLRLDPGDFNALMSRAVAANQLGDPLRAVELYDRILTLQTPNGVTCSALVERARIRGEQGRWEEAMADWERALVSASDDPSRRGEIEAEIRQAAARRAGR